MDHKPFLVGISLQHLEIVLIDLSLLSDVGDRSHSIFSLILHKFVFETKEVKVLLVQENRVLKQEPLR